MLHLLTHWLWINPVGGCITRQSVCRCFTKYKVDGNIYRAHPSFRSEHAKYDWAYFKLDDNSSWFLGQIILFLDLSDCTFISEDEALLNLGHNNILLLEKIELSPSQYQFIEDEGSMKNYLSQHNLWVLIKSSSENNLYSSSIFIVLI